MEPYKTKFNQKREYAALQSFKERLKCDRHCWKHMEALLFLILPIKNFQKMSLYVPYEQFLINIQTTFCFLIFSILPFIVLFRRTRFFVYKTFNITNITALSNKAKIFGILISLRMFHV